MICLFVKHTLLFFKWAKPGLFLFLFLSHDKCITNLTNKDKSLDGLLRTRTWGGRIIGADESSELWWNPVTVLCFNGKVLNILSMFSKYRPIVGEGKRS